MISSVTAHIYAVPHINLLNWLWSSKRFFTLIKGLIWKTNRNCMGRRRVGVVTQWRRQEARVGVPLQLRPWTFCLSWWCLLALLRERRRRSDHACWKSTCPGRVRTCPPPPAVSGSPEEIPHPHQVCDQVCGSVGRTVLSAELPAAGSLPSFLCVTYS